MLVPWTPGGATDIQMRALCEIAARHLGQPIVVENRPGAGGTLAAQMLARDARPDGYTLAQLPNGVFRVPAMVDRAPFDPLADFTWIIRLAGYTTGLVVRADAPWRDFAAFLADAKARPGEIAFGTPGANTTDIQMKRIARQAGIDWLAVPFRGAAPNMQALLGGQIQASAETSAWADLVLERRLRLLVVWSAERAARFPDAPTLRESGFNLVSDAAYGIGGPRGMDPAVVAKLHDAFKAALFDPVHLAVLARYDMPVRYLGTKDYALAARQQNEEERRTVRELGLRME